MDLFKESTDEIFKAAGLTKEEAPEMYEDVELILSQKMAGLSASMGLSVRRVDAYREQKESLIKELRALKADGTLR